MQALKTIVALLLTAAAAHAEPQRPNIVVFLVDDMGWGDSGTYGHPLTQTPHLDRLAAEGVKFTQCYAASGVCSPSRSAILTGRTPYRNGVWRHLSGVHKAHLRTSELTYIRLLKEAGYATCHAGKWHLSPRNQFNADDFPDPGDHGYDDWLYTHNNASPSHKNPDNFYRKKEPLGEWPGYSASLVAADAVRWMKEDRDPAKPFALSVWTHEPHHPIATDPRFSERYGDHDNKTYMGNITQLDAALGQIMEALDEQGLADNTFLFFTSDNGPVPKYGGSSGGLRSGKRSGYEGGIRVPGVARWPGHIEPGTVSHTPVIGSDVFATALDIAGLPLPDDRKIDGVSMRPAFSGQPVRRQTPLFWRTHVSGAECRVAVRVGDWKLVGNDTLTEFQLYDIENDPKERRNRAAELPEKTQELKTVLLEVWADIENEGPSEWWRNAPQPPIKGSTLNY